VPWSSHVLASWVPSHCLSVYTQCNLANMFRPSSRKSNIFTAIMLSKTQWIVSHKIPLKIRQQTSLQIGLLKALNFGPLLQSNYTIITMTTAFIHILPPQRISPHHAPTMCSIQLIHWPGGVLSYIGDSKRYVFLAVLVDINGLSILAILLINRVWFCTPVLNWTVRPSTKALHKLYLRQLCQPQRSKVGYRIFGQIT